MKIIKRALRGTSFVVTLALTEKQFRHFEVAEGRMPSYPGLLDPAIMREMIGMAGHLGKARPMEEMAALVADVAGDILELARRKGGD